MDALDDLDRQRASAPVGTVVQGTVAYVPRPTGVIGVFVDLGLPTGGFIDLGELPLDTDRWPAVGDNLTLEVQQHRQGQIRLSPLDPALRRHPALSWRCGESDITSRYPVGAVVDMTVTYVFTANRECSVSDGYLDTTVEWSGERPIEGASMPCRVERHGAITRQVVLAPLPAQAEPGSRELE